MFLLDVENHIKLLNTCHFDMDVYKEVYENVSVIWEITNPEPGLQKFFTENKFGFYESLENVDLGKLYSLLYNINQTLKDIKRQQTEITNIFKSKPVCLFPQSELTKQTKPVNVKEIKLKNDCLKITKDKLGDVEFSTEKQTIDYSPINIDNCVYIYFNNYFENVYTSEKVLDLDLFPELELLLKLSGTKENLNKFVEKIEDTFLDKQNLINFIDLYIYQHEENTLEHSIEKLLRENYTITSSIDDKIQFSYLYNQIKNHFDNDIKNILPKILNKIGLKKKRFSQGMFWYGLKMKPVNLLTETGYNISVTEKEYKKLLEDRNVRYTKEIVDSNTYKKYIKIKEQPNNVDIKKMLGMNNISECDIQCIIMSDEEKNNLTNKIFDVSIGSKLLR